MSAGADGAPRAFAAVDWHEADRAPLLDLQAMLRRAPGATDCRWTVPDDLHLTLRFLGDASAAQVEGLRDALTHLAGGLRRDAVGFAALERWPGVLVARFTASAALLSCQARLEDAVQALGFAPERRPFAPHVTLARLPTDGTIELPRIKLAPFALPVGRLVLCCRASTPTAGRRYTTLATIELAPPGR